MQISLRSIKRPISLKALEETAEPLPPRRASTDTEETRNEAARQLQAAKYPTAAEAGTGGPGDVAPGGPAPFSLWTAGKTMLSDLASPLMLTRSREDTPEFLRGYDGPRTAARTVYNLATDLGRSRVHSEDEAGRAWAEGDYPAAITRGIANMIPGVGPMIANMGEEAGRDPGVGAGHVAAAVAGPKIVRGVAKTAAAPIATAKSVLKAPAKAYRATRDFAIDKTLNAKGVEPHMSVFNAIKPRNFIRNADKRVEGTMEEINRGAEITGKPTVDIFSFGDNLNAALKERMAQRRQIDAANPIEISGAPIAKAIIDSVPKLNRVSNPAAYEAIKTWARETWNKKFNADDIVDMLEDANASASVQGYYQKLPGQQTALNHRLDSSMANAQAGAMRKLLIGEFNKFSGTGTARQQVNAALRDLITTKDLYDRRYNVELRQAVQSLPQQVSKLLAIGKFGKAGAHLAAGNVGMAAIETATGMSEVALGNFLRELNSTNGQIASAFRRFNGRPKPLTVSPVNRYNQALRPARSTVQPQDLTGSATPGSTSAQYQWQRQGAQPLPRQTGIARDPLTGQYGREAEFNLRDFLDQERTANRLGLQTTRPTTQNVPDFIDVDFRHVSGSPIEQPASGLPETRQIGVGSGQQAGRRVFQMPESPLTSRDVLDVGTAKSEIVRDPKTGRFKKVFTSMSEWNKAKGDKGAVRIYHGSPYVFDKFDIKKYGTGEGATVLEEGQLPGEGGGGHYGVGMNFSTSKRNAEAYRKWSPSQLKMMSKYNTPTKGGATYYLDLTTAEQKRLLDFDKPISRQTPEVKKALEKIEPGISSWNKPPEYLFVDDDAVTTKQLVDAGIIGGKSGNSGGISGNQHTIYDVRVLKRGKRVKK